MALDLDPNDDTQFEPVGGFMDETTNNEYENPLSTDFPTIQPLADRQRFIEPPAQKTPVEKKEDDDDEEDLTTDYLDSIVDQDEKRELEELNKKLGTSFNSMEELRNSLKSTDRAPADQEYQEAKRMAQILDDAVNRYSDVELIVQHQIRQSILRGQEMSPEEIETYRQNYEYKYASSDRDQVEAQALGLRTYYGGLLDKNMAIVNKHEGLQKQTEEQKIAAKKLSWQQAIIDISNKGNFYGMQLTKQDLVKAYNDVSKNRLIEHINSNPSAAVELQLFLNKREDLKEVTGSATYSDGIKATLDKIRGQQPEERQLVRNDKRGKLSDMDSFIASFVK